ncbi:MAG: DUF3486 family protein [Deltaproteobacteria bacterium]|nr:DUF3486 family protein [Deltaproteobacteria bacterium]
MRRSFVAQLPKSIQNWLKDELSDRNFSDYQEVTELLNERLEKEGMEIQISKTSLFRWSKKVEKENARLKWASEVAIRMQEALPDDKGALNDTLTRMMQTHLLELLMELELDSQTVDIYRLSKSIADLGRASVSQKKWEAEYNQRIAAKLEELERAEGLDAPTLAKVREEIYGVTP